jgi:hypothetical protein
MGELAVLEICDIPGVLEERRDVARNEVSSHTMLDGERVILISSENALGAIRDDADNEVALAANDDLLDCRAEVANALLLVELSKSSV